MLFLQITSFKSRHPLGCVGALAGTHRPPGERPVCLSGFRLASRASTLFCLIRPGRANRQNSPARASDEAGPTAILALRDASVRSFVPTSAASCRMAVGPVSPDARAAFASGCCAPCLRPERATPGQTGKIWPGGHFSSPPSWARGASVLFAVLRILHRFALLDAGRSLPVAKIKGNQQLLAVDASPRVGRSNHRLAPLALCSTRLRPVAKAPWLSPLASGNRRRRLQKRNAANSFWLLTPPYRSAEATRCVSDFATAKHCHCPAFGGRGLLASASISFRFSGRRQLRPCHCPAFGGRGSP